MPSKNLYSFIFVLIVVGFGLYLASAFKNAPQTIPEISSTGATGLTTAASNVSPAIKKETKVLMESQEKEEKEIALYNLESRTKKIIFSDRGEGEKIKFSRSAEGQLFIGTTSPANPENVNLYHFSTDGKKTKLASDLSSIQPIAVSPNAEKAALISFSNAEKDFGFSLHIYDLTNKKSVTIFKDPDGIYSPAFLNNEEIILIKNVAGAEGKKPSFEIKKIDLGTKNSETIYSSEARINSLAPSNSEVLLSEGTKESILKALNLKDRKTVLLATFKGVVLYPYRLSDSRLVFLLDGQLAVYDLTSKTITKFVPATNVLGVEK